MSRFSQLQSKIESKGESASAAGAIAAAAGRKKYGAKKFQAMAAEGRRRSKKKGR